MKVRGRPFVPGDLRINRGGRPKLYAELRATCQDMTPELVARLKSLALAADKDSTSVAATALLLAYAWGKPMDDGGLYEVDGEVTARSTLEPDERLRALDFLRRLPDGSGPAKAG